MDKNRALEYIKNKYPEACCELNYKSDLDLLVAIILSAQTTDKAVNITTLELFQKYKTIDDYVNADIDELKLYIARIGLANNKSKNIISMAKKVSSDFNGIIPNNKEDLMTLAGVGNKTASVFLAEYYEYPYMGVDTHVSRVSKRLYLALEKDSPVIIERKLEKIIKKEDIHLMHHRMIFFGRYHCLARNPKCNECELTDICRYYKKEYKNGKRIKRS